MAPSSSDHLVCLRKVTRRYRQAGSTVEVRALDLVDLTVDRGESVAIMGPSGSGKSTLLHLIGALDLADEGSVVVDGVELTLAKRRELVQLRRRIGMVFQRFHLLPTLNAVENVLAARVPFGVRRDDVESAERLLSEMELGDRLRSLPSQMSGGEQQRVALARGLINDPVLLLADEPTGNLDSETGRTILSMIRYARQKYGLTVLITTHDAEVAASCDRVVRLRDGRVCSDHRVDRDMDDHMLSRVLRLRPD